VRRLRRVVLRVVLVPCLRVVRVCRIRVWLLGVGACEVCRGALVLCVLGHGRKALNGRRGVRLHMRVRRRRRRLVRRIRGLPVHRGSSRRVGGTDGREHRCVGEVGVGDGHCLRFVAVVSAFPPRHRSMLLTISAATGAEACRLPEASPSWRWFACMSAGTFGPKGIYTLLRSAVVFPTAVRVRLGVYESRPRGRGHEHLFRVDEIVKLERATSGGGGRVVGRKRVERRRGEWLRGVRGGGGASSCTVIRR